mmetsp:Transcript_3651/g.10931  ORF Transcript_3651/g.10931 Transcript_3651/m.10931 type:complete len:126 (-) Transcript_3651:215-592(-)
MWSVGVVLYNMLSGELPFDDEHDAGTIFRKILTAEPDFSPGLWKDISSEAVNLIRALLNKNPDKRVSAAVALKDPWLKVENVPDKLLQNDRSTLHSSRRIQRMESLRKPGAPRSLGARSMPAAAR